MPTTITLKGIPDDIYARLKVSAGINRRSVNSEAIACLEARLLPQRTSADEQLLAIRALRGALSRQKFDHRKIDAIKRQGRA